MSVGLAVVVDLVAAQPDSRDRSLGTQAPPRPARDFTIWATITSLGQTCLKTYFLSVKL